MRPGTGHWQGQTDYRVTGRARLTRSCHRLLQTDLRRLLLTGIEGTIDLVPHHGRCQGELSQVFIDIIRRKKAQRAAAQ